MKAVIAFLSWVAAVLFGTAAMLLPPQGEIDTSVLMLIAQLLLLCATLLGVEHYVDKIHDIMKKQS